MSRIPLVSRVLAALGLCAASLAASAAIDINKASADQLQALKGIGPTLSSRIMEARQKSVFKNWGDLIDRVSGLGTAKAAKLSAEGLTVAGAAYAATDSMVTAVVPAKKPMPSAVQPSAGRPLTPAPAAVRLNPTAGGR